MRKLISFNFLTLNGFYKGPNGDISWHTHGGEENEYAEKGAQSESILVFGRITYEMMAGYWPSAQAKKTSPVVADGMNKGEKIVFSKTLKNADWPNTTLLKGDAVSEMKTLKKTAGKNMTILGSGSIVSQFADAGLIDEFQFMVDPVALGSGTSIFSGIKNPLKLTLTNSKSFKSGVTLLCYAPA